MKFFRKVYFKILFFTGFFLVPGIFYAQVGDPAPGDFELKNPLGNVGGLLEFLNMILSNVVIPIGAVVVVFFVIYSGFLFVTAGGSEEKLKKAKATFTWTVIGAAIVLGSLAISYAISATIESIQQDATSEIINTLITFV